MIDTCVFLDVPKIRKLWLFGSSVGRLGALSELPSAVLRRLGSAWAVLGQFRGNRGFSGAAWARLGGVLERSWGRLGASWGRLGASWGCLGASWGRLGASRRRLGPILANLRPSLGGFWERIRTPSRS